MTKIIKLVWLEDANLFRDKKMYLPFLDAN